MPLILRNLNNVYEFVSENVCYDKESDNMIIFNPVDEGLNYETICNRIMPNPLNHLIETLNNNSNVLVVWSQMKGTTSDYTIYHNVNTVLFNQLKYKTILKKLDSLCEDPINHMKYTEVKDGNMTAIQV